MSNSKRKRMLRVIIQEELKKRGMPLDYFELERISYWRDMPNVDHQSDYIIPHDLLVFRCWFAGIAPGSYRSKQLAQNFLLHSQPRGSALKAIGAVP